MKKNTVIITGLFMLMILAFTVDPTFIYHFQDNLLGKAMVILVLIYLTMNSVTLGLLFTLVIILISSRVDVPMIEDFKNIKRRSKLAKKRKKCKTLEELLREERLKRMKKKRIGGTKITSVSDNIATTTPVTAATTSADTNNDKGVDRITVEETFRVRNPSTIPVTKEAFRVRQLNPADNASKYYGGSCSLI